MQSSKVTVRRRLGGRDFGGADDDLWLSNADSDLGDLGSHPILQNDDSGSQPIDQERQGLSVSDHLRLAAAGKQYKVTLMH